MSQQDLLKRVTRFLNNNGIDYMITGSIASSLQGEPRTTHDVDIIVDIHKPAVEEFIKAFPVPDFYLSRESMIDAIDRKSMFNLISAKDGGKVDFWMITDEPFDRSRFSRKQLEYVAGLQIYVSAPEDTILAKLKWAKDAGGSEKHFVDSIRIYEVQLEQLDMEYLEHWSKRLGIELLWKRLKDEAEVI
jgi:hypothetical protein